MDTHGEYMTRQNRRRPRSQTHRRALSRDLSVTMPPLPNHPPSLRHLSSDPVSGIPYYFHNTDNASSSHSSVTSNPSATEIPGNMLGAKARAAEYNAAKAATARQQANRDSEESRPPPKPTPVSLSAFTRNASYNRNRGAKSFIPLILSEEEEKKSTSSVEFATEADQTDSPKTEPDLVTRPASLPPPQTFPVNKNDQECSIQTPLRYISPRSQVNMYPTASRSVYHDDGYVFSNMGTPFHQPPFFLHPQARPFSLHQNMIPTSQNGWYAPGGYYSPHQSYPDAGVFLTSSHSEPRPQLHHHNLSQDSNIAAEPTKESSSEPAPDSTHPTTPAPVTGLGGPTMYTFGPDDISPSKMEIKQRAREAYFAKNPPRDTVVATVTPARQATGHNPTTTNSRVLSGNIRDLLIDHDSVAPVRVRESSMSTVPFPKLEDFTEPEPLELCDTTASWSTSSVHYPYRQAGLSDSSPIRQIRNKRNGVSGDDLGQAPINMIMPGQDMDKFERYQSQSPSASTSSLSEAVADELERLEDEKARHIQSLLTDTSHPGWCVFGAPTDEDRQRVKMFRKAMRTSVMTDKMRDLMRIKHEELRGPFEQNLREHERRRKGVQALADEMQHKWEHGGEFRGPTMTKSQAESQAGKVKEIGNMMLMLSMQVDSRDGLYHLGSRPYTQPPEYAIERSVGVDKEGTTSLFEQEGHEGRAAPPRLARDPRFRAQLAEGIKIRGDEERIPRMFVARSRVQN